MKLNHKNKQFIIAMFIIIMVLLIFCLWQNNNIVTTNIKYGNVKLPSEFNDYTIVHISDLHNKRFGENQTKLINKIKLSSPNIIVITGDLIDERRINIDIAMEFVREAIKLAPVFYVSGNHEARSSRYDEIKQGLLDIGVEVLDDSSYTLYKDEASIRILGLSDPSFISTTLEDSIKQLSDSSSFQLLLSHRPELFDIYVKNDIDLAFTGHAHGGQIRIPFIGGIFAPNQGLFPRYTNGVYIKDNTTMVVSRGLGNSLFPVRVFNRPEIVVTTLTNSK